MFIFVSVAIFAYLQIGYRLGHATHTRFEACATSSNPLRKSFGVRALLPSHAGEMGSWHRSDFPLVAPWFKMPESYGVVSSPFWPIKVLVTLGFHARNGLRHVRFSRIIDSFFRPERLLIAFIRSRPTKTSLALEAKPAAVPGVARIEEIDSAIARLMAERTELAKAPDAKRL
jgi:hypothetical protein